MGQEPQVADLEIAARMIEQKIRDEWIKLGGTANCSAIVDYREETGVWEARPVRDGHQ